MEKTAGIAIPAEEIAQFCRRWKIQRLELFGSALRPDFRPDSDVDFLYTLAPEARWGWEFYEAEEQLAQIIGRPVDLVSRKGIQRSRNEIRRREILETAKVIYAA